MASSILNALVPICAAYFGSVGVLVVRIFLGISQSLLYPTLNNMLGKWGPVQERSRLGCLIFAGKGMLFLFFNWERSCVMSTLK